jgi:uncharacterized integral membrane protein
MNIILSGLRWALRASIFIGLLAFALNNTQEVRVHLFFGHIWQTPLVLLVLVSFIVGLLLGVLGVFFSMHFPKQRRVNTSPMTPGLVPTTPADGVSKSPASPNTTP